ncbi:MAG: hypothetical protein ABSG33_01860 [Candidatus Bathyarchaeia archaeon]|jgi:hypothetical protein
MAFFVRTSKPEDWQLFLAEPDRQWKDGYSAKTLAYCWMNAKGLPKSVENILCENEAFIPIQFLAGFVEHKVYLPGGGHPSQNDILVLARLKKGLAVIAVEGKVSEPFGETIAEWLNTPSKGKTRRLDFLSGLLGIRFRDFQDVRYQFTHRAASALIEAKRFGASTAVMLIHSFSKDSKWFGDYSKFVALFGIKAFPNKAYLAKRIDEIDLYFAWVSETCMLLK